MSFEKISQAICRLLPTAVARVCARQNFEGSSFHSSDRGRADVGVKQTEVLALCKEFGIELLTVPTSGKNVIELDGKRGVYSGTIPPLSVASLIDIQLAINKIDAAARNINAAEPWKSANAKQLDSMTVSTYLNRS